MTVLVGTEPIPPSGKVRLSERKVLKLSSDVYVTIKSVISISAPDGNCQDRSTESLETLEAVKFSMGLSGTVASTKMHYVIFQTKYCSFIAYPLW